jgi:hypothetical protein
MSKTLLRPTSFIKTASRKKERGAHTKNIPLEDTRQGKFMIFFFFLHLEKLVQ